MNGRYYYVHWAVLHGTQFCYILVKLL
jgi:hypothetical protein